VDGDTTSGCDIEQREKDGGRKCTTRKTSKGKKEKGYMERRVRRSEDGG
jgi:hypothetical protein